MIYVKIAEFLLSLLNFSDEYNKCVLYECCQNEKGMVRTTFSKRENDSQIKESQVIANFKLTLFYTGYFTNAF